VREDSGVILVSRDFSTYVLFPLVDFFLANLYLETFFEFHRWDGLKCIEVLDSEETEKCFQDKRLHSIIKYQS
jgi:hypothetical protein